MLIRKSKKRWNGWDYIFKIITFIAIITLWEGIVRGLNVSSSIFPTATATISSFFKIIVDAKNLMHLWATFSETAIGFFLGSLSGVLLGILVAEVQWVKKLVFPYIIALNSVPKMALAPLFLVWFGFGIASKLAIIIVTTFFPVLINMVAGLRKIDESQIKLLQAYSATSWQIFRRVKLPGSLPYLFTGLEIAIVFSVIGGIISEFVGADKGLGFLMLFYNSQFKIAEMFAVLLLISIMGYMMLFCVQLVSRRVVFWQGKSNARLE
jgi:NitT/TauT family transport system permease protein